MSRDNRKNDVRRRIHYTGEAYQQAHGEITDLGKERPLIPDAQHPAQQRVESAVLHRLLAGARAQWSADVRPMWPLFVEAACPSTTGLRVVVPVRDVAAFGAALAMRRTADVIRPPADKIMVRSTDGVTRLTAAGDASAVVDLECSWKKLCSAVEADPHVSAPSPLSLRFDAHPALQLPPDTRAALSGLLRRIALFVKPDALDWLFICYEWALRGRKGAIPRLPDSLVADLTDKNFGLHHTQLHALGIDRLSWSRGGKRGSEDGESRSLTYAERRDLSTARALATPAVRASGLGTIPTGGPSAYQEGRLRESARRYNELAVTVMRLDPEYPIKREFFAMRFPERWMEPLRSLEAASRSGEFAYIATLNDVITAAVPDCVVTRPYAAYDIDQNWLLAHHPVNPDVIFHLITAWVRAQKATPEQIQWTLSQLSPADLNWSSVSISPNLPFSQLARLIPMEVAATLSRPDAQGPFNNLRFVRCPTNNGAELMSWPPEGIENREPFSVTIGISTHTVPFSSELLVHLSFGVRRWMPSRGNLTIDRSYPAYFAPTHRSLSELPSSPHLGTAKIELVRVRQEGGRTAWMPGWQKAMASVLDQAGYLSQLPDPRQLVAEPSELLSRRDAAAMVYRRGMLPWVKVSEGLPIADRAPLMSWVIGELTPHLRPAEPLPREKCTIYKGLATAAKGVIASDALRAVIGPRLTVELLTESELTTQYALDCLGERLGVEFPRADELGEAETLLDLGSVSIGVRRMTTPSEYVDFRGDRRRPQAAVKARVDLITAPLGQATHPTITLVEILDSDRYVGETDNADLKFALQYRLMCTGRLSQFVTTVVEAQSPLRLGHDRESPDPSHARFSGAIDDLFRQLGVRPVALPLPAANTLPRRPTLLGIWMIRQNNRRGRSARQQLPVAVLSDPTGQRVLVRTPEIAWQPLHVGLLEIGREHGTTERKYKPKDTTRFIREVIYDVIADYPDTLLLTHAQNLRREWAFLTNSHLDMDMVEFDSDSRQPIATLPGLRHVRVRTAEFGETPECYGINGDGVGQPTGLWRYLEPRLFGSTAGKPATHANASMNVSKIEPGMRTGKTIRLNPKAEVWNEQFVELLVAGVQDGDRPEHWAALAHNLRNATPYSHWTTMLPWPLNLAKQIEKYISFPA
ncbi:hypothetical protein Acor_74690 [Acrocarpospora corrugata]|uniref:DUF3893 domain-containing protein n=1 Tax=Acrocarpospora corrugata TaxID=35763 RepID=A0A5M3WEA4_9ACTN|nr:DUF3962 domain-containing protein [Acrocarpospora corrugata]GES05401.1 hypothetical protein Acor_74690 [Acrocarpospora corrugata]